MNDKEKTKKGVEDINVTIKHLSHKLCQKDKEKMSRALAENTLKIVCLCFFFFEGDKCILKEGNWKKKRYKLEIQEEYMNTVEKKRILNGKRFNFFFMYVQDPKKTQQ